MEAETAKKLSRLAAEHDVKYKAQIKDLESVMDKRKKEQEGRLRHLEAKIKKDREAIGKLNIQLEALRLQLKNKSEKCKDIDKAKDGYKQDKEELEEKLEDLQKEFSLNSKPLEY